MASHINLNLLALVEIYWHGLDIGNSESFLICKHRNCCLLTQEYHKVELWDYSCLIFINDLPNEIWNDAFMLAHDTSLMSILMNSKNIISSVNTDLQIISSILQYFLNRIINDAVVFLVCLNKTKRYWKTRVFVYFCNLLPKLLC